MNLSQRLLAKGAIFLIRLDVNRTSYGLESALEGIDELRAGKVSGMKLVYTL